MILIKNFKKFLVSLKNLFLRQDSYQIFCCYVNQTKKIQLIKISNNCNENWQQIVLPGECFSFKALLKSELEIYDDQNSTSIIDVIPCPKLEIVF
ncbi:hypothetical protein STA3757_42720 [Stanieria sp. NIES-3757]|nr:hypothetical protein STA3757_42720 [Stanieria sp. NIES-3757]